jgi:hypothetical protein
MRSKEGEKRPRGRAQPRQKKNAVANKSHKEDHECSLKQSRKSGETNVIPSKEGKEAT